MRSGSNKKMPKTNKNENTTTQNIWDTGKAVLTGKIIAVLDYLMKQEESQTI